MVGCYKFDRPYFSWLRKITKPQPPEVPNGVWDSSAVVQLLPHRAGGDTVGYVLRVPLYAVEASAARAEAGRMLFSNWRVEDNGKQLVFSWLDGYAGPVLRMNWTSGDTLRGRFRFTSDAQNGTLDEVGAAWAVRIPCGK